MAIELGDDHPYWAYHYLNMNRYAEQVRRHQKRFGVGQVRIVLSHELQADARRVCRDLFAFIGVNPSHDVGEPQRYKVGGHVPSVAPGRLLYRPSAGNELVKRVLPNGMRRGLKQRLDRANVDPDSKPRMDPRTRERLRETFAEDIRELQELIAKDLSHWLDA